MSGGVRVGGLACGGSPLPRRGHTHAGSLRPASRECVDRGGGAHLLCASCRRVCVDRLRLLALALRLRRRRLSRLLQRGRLSLLLLLSLRQAVLNLQRGRMRVRLGEGRGRRSMRRRARPRTPGAGRSGAIPLPPHRPDHLISPLTPPRPDHPIPHLFGIPQLKRLAEAEQAVVCGHQRRVLQVLRPLSSQALQPRRDVLADELRRGEGKEGGDAGVGVRETRLGRRRFWGGAGGRREPGEIAPGARIPSAARPLDLDQPGFLSDPRYRGGEAWGMVLRHPPFGSRRAWPPSWP